ncbi:MAG: T9SS type A sorting domain-containing protein [Candidatus Kapaibacterium sp.]
MQHYLDSSSTYFLNEKNLDLQGERFTLEQPIILNSVTLKVLGAKGETGEVVLYGNEGGNPLPIYESKLVDGIKFEKSYNGLEWITIDLNGLIINETQIFVCVKLDESEIITSRTEIAAECYSSNCSDFRYQVIKKEGEWVSGIGSFLMKLDYNLLSSNNDFLFSEFDIKDESLLNQKVKSVGVFDLNNDNMLDIVTNRGVFINKINLFESVSYKNDSSGNFTSVVYFSNDLDKHLILNLSLDSLEGTKVYEPIFDENSFELELKNEQKLLFNNITSYNLFQNVFTNEQSLLIIDNHFGKSILYLYDLKQDFFLELKDSVIVDFQLNTLNLIENGLDKQLLVTAKTGEILYFTVNEKSIKFERIVSLEPEYLLGGINVIDIDNDNYKDTILTLQNLQPSFKNKTNIMYERREKRSSYPKIKYDDEFVDIKQLDLDNDSKNDLILFTDCDCRKSKIFSKNSNDYTDVSYKAGFDLRSLGPSAVVADFNDDGKLDFVSLLRGSIKIYNNESTSFGNSVAFLSNSKIKQIEIYSNGEKRISYPNSNNNYLFQSPNYVHTGLGNNLIDSAFAVNDRGRYRVKNLKLNHNNFLSDDNSIEYSKIQEQVNTYPNPFKDNVNFNIVTENTDDISLIIYNMEGNIIFEKSINNNGSSQNYNWNGLDIYGVAIANGVYNYLIVTGKQNYEGKIIKVD